MFSSVTNHGSMLIPQTCLLHHRNYYTINPIVVLSFTEHVLDPYAKCLFYLFRPHNHPIMLFYLNFTKDNRKHLLSAYMCQVYSKYFINKYYYYP